MAHRPLELQTAISGRSFMTYSVGCAPGYKGGILLFNPNTKRYIVRRTFKVIGPSVPKDYQFPIQFEAVDTYVDDAEIPTLDVDDDVGGGGEGELRVLEGAAAAAAAVVMVVEGKWSVRCGTMA